MKILHWTVIFLAIIIPFSVICRNTVNSRFTALKDEVRINNAIDSATKDAIDQIIVLSDSFSFDDEFGDVINITPSLAQESINTFFHTLAVNYNISYKESDNTKLGENSSESYIKNYFAPYVPAIVILAYDGFYVYSQENNGSGYEYQLSSKIPYAYEANGYTIGYTLGNDIYLYADGKNYSGKLTCSTYDEAKTKLEEYQVNYDESGLNGEMSLADYIDLVSNDMSVIIYALSLEHRDINFDYIMPQESDNNFLQDYVKNESGNYTVGKFHQNRRKVIINILTSCLNEEINEHNRFADMVGNTYEFVLPEIPEDDWVTTINDISFMAFVQGIPIGTLDGEYFNSYALGGSQIVKKDHVYGSKYNGTQLYHQLGCEFISGENYDFEFLSEEDAIANGYIYPCLKCN